MSFIFLCRCGLTRQDGGMWHTLSRLPVSLCAPWHFAQSAEFEFSALHTTKVSPVTNVLGKMNGNRSSSVHLLTVVPSLSGAWGPIAAVPHHGRVVGTSQDHTINVDCARWWLLEKVFFQRNFFCFTLCKMASMWLACVLKHRGSKDPRWSNFQFCYRGCKESEHFGLICMFVFKEQLLQVPFGAILKRDFMTGCCIT